MAKLLLRVFLWGLGLTLEPKIVIIFSHTQIISLSEITIQTSNWPQFTTVQKSCELEKISSSFNQTFSRSNQTSFPYRSTSHINITVSLRIWRFVSSLQFFPTPKSREQTSPPMFLQVTSCERKYAGQNWPNSPTFRVLRLHASSK